MMSEQDIQHLCFKLLREAGCIVYKMPSGSFKTEDGRFVAGCPPGTPDAVLGLPDGLFAMAEIKRPGQYLSYLQRLSFRKLDSMGFRWAIFDDPGQISRFLSDKTYHGEDRWVKQVFTDPKEPAYKPPMATGLMGTPWEPLKRAAEERRRLADIERGSPPF